MATLRGRNPKNTVQELLKINASGLTSTLATVESGEGISTPFQLSTTQIALNGLTWPTTGASAGNVLTVSSNGTSLEWAASGGSSSWDDLTDKPAVIAAGATASDARAAIGAVNQTAVDTWIPEYFTVVNIRGVISSVTIGGEIFAGSSATWAEGQLRAHATTGDIYTVQSDGSVVLTSAMPANGIRFVKNSYGIGTPAGLPEGLYIFRAVNSVVTRHDAVNVTASRVSIQDKNSNYVALSARFTNVDNTSDADKPISTATQTALNGKVSTGAVPYDIAAPVFGKPAASEIVLRVRTQRAFTLDTFYGYAVTAATGSSAVFTVAKNGTSIGTITFNTSTNASTTTVPTTSFSVGDVLTITAPSSQNATLADVDFFLKGVA